MAKILAWNTRGQTRCLYSQAAGPGPSWRKAQQEALLVETSKWAGLDGPLATGWSAGRMTLDSCRSVAKIHTKAAFLPGSEPQADALNVLQISTRMRMVWG